MAKTWQDVLGTLKDHSTCKEALAYYDKRAAEGVHCFPSRDELFNAFRFTPFNELKVIMIGQDPYPTPGNAMGLAFSVRPNVKVPASLKNIYKELQTDIPGFKTPEHGCLTYWAQQGVLMLNAILSVEEGKPLAHARHGWEQFTDDVIQAINQHSEHNVFFLWGGKAKAKCTCVDRERNLILEAAHPSPLSARNGFFGCKHFSQANAYLESVGKTPIDWQLPLQAPVYDMSSLPEIE